MNRVPHAIPGFTLIELMLSIALGSLIVYTAMAGFRTASQTVTAANRLSLENSMLRAGYWEAQNQLDFWTNLDDPTLPDLQRPLKGVGPISYITLNTSWPLNPSSTQNSTLASMNRGMLFTPLSVLSTTPIGPFPGMMWPKAGPARGSGATDLNSIMPRQGGMAASAQLTDSWEGDTGWDPTYSWAPHDPRTWSRANLAEKDRQKIQQPNGSWVYPDKPNTVPPMINGRYAIFAHTSPGADLYSYDITPDPNVTPAQPSVTVTYASYPAGGIHTWYYRQLAGLINAMGYAAFCDYLPANAIYTWYSEFGSRIPGDAPSSLRTPGDMNKFGTSPEYCFCNGDGNQRNSRGIYRNTYATSYGYLNPRSSDTYRIAGSSNPPGPVNLRQWHFWHYETDYNAWDTTATGWSGVTDMQWFLSHACFPEKLMPQKPDNWPQVQVSVGRLIKNAHFVAVAKVRRTSPLTGEVIELSWCGLGSTLRGARQQRKRDAPGWASWDNSASATIDPNLDTP